MNRVRGFTLVELIVVIAVIGLLASIVVLGLSRYQADTRDARRASSATAIAEALEKYYENNGEYPSCEALTRDGQVVATEELGGIRAETLVAPQAPSTATNSINCATLTTNGADFFEYSGDGSTACATNGSCLQYTLKYKEEVSGSIKSVPSRHTTAIATSGVTTLTLQEADFNSLTVQWAPVPNAAGYTIERSSSSAFTSPTTITATGSATSAVISGLSLNTTYYLRIKATSSQSEGNWSSTLTAKTLSIGRPTLTCTANSNSQITVNWGAVANADSYTFRYSTHSDMSSPTQTTGITTTSRVLTGLSTGVTYYFQAKAVNASFESTWSTTIDCTTFVPTPSCISASTDNATSITVTWCEVSVAQKYTLEYDDDSDFSSPAGSIPNILGTEQQVTELNQGVTYYFRVYAVVGTTSSVPSSSANATTPVNKPSKPNVKAYTPGTTRAYSAGNWIAFTESPQSGNWYFSYATATGSCPAGTSKRFAFAARYSSPTTLYGYTSYSTTATKYMIRPTGSYKIKFYGRVRCYGPNATSPESDYDTACASNTGSNVTCF